MRLHELHPMLTHFSITLLPAAVGIEMAARITEDENLEKLGRVTMLTAAGTSAVTAASGLVAEQEVKGTERARSMLRTHKYLNLANGGVTTAMSAYRLFQRRPGWGYLGAGLGSLGVLAYSAYLGGQMVYDEGMGVDRADGVRREQAPRIRPGNFKTAFFALGRQLKEGVKGLFGGLVPKTTEVMEEEYIGERLRRDNERPGALPLGPTR